MIVNYNSNNMTATFFATIYYTTTTTTATYRYHCHCHYHSTLSSTTTTTTSKTARGSNDIVINNKGTSSAAKTNKLACTISN